MSVTNEERRAAANTIRRYNGEANCMYLIKYAVCRGDLDTSERAFLNRLADLIDPDPDLTCELEPTASERTNAPVRVYECDCCGKSCDVVYAEDYVYCPYCGRLNTAREVEVEE